MEANCNGALSAVVPKNGLEKVPLDDDGGDPSNRPLSSSASSSSCSSSTASLSGQPSKLKSGSEDNNQSKNDKAQAFTRKFDVFVQYLASKGVFIIDCKSLLDGRSCSVQREYEDFRGLHDLLETLSRRVTITPPLPPFCPLSELLDADEAPTEQQAHLFYFGGDALKTLGEYKIVPSQAAAFAYYLDAVLRHPLLGSIAQVEEFLAHARFSRPEIDTAHFSHRRSLFNNNSSKTQSSSSSSSILSYVSSKFGRSNGANSNGVNGASSSSSGVSPTASSSISDAANGTGGEESFYECCRAHTALAEEKLSAVKGSLEVVLASTTKLANVISHLSTCVLATLVINAPDQSAKSSSASTTTTTTFYRTFVSSLEKYRAHLEVEAPMTEETLLSALRYLLAYNASFRSMLARRQELALAYETANRNFQRQMDSGSGGMGGGSSASKKNYERAAAEKRHAEADFEKFNESGREEVERYQAQRARLLATAIGRYVEGQLVMAKHTAAMLKGCIASLKAIE